MIVRAFVLRAVQQSTELSTAKASPSASDMESFQGSMEDFQSLL
jgi:hypothetical protein